MIRPSPSHRLLNLVQTMLILGGMAAIACVIGVRSKFTEIAVRSKFISKLCLYISLLHL